MTIPVKFNGGPLHSMTGQTAVLEQILLFWDMKERKCHAYQRSDELAYTFDAAMSSALTANFDTAREKLGGGNSPVTWPDET